MLDEIVRVKRLAVAKDKAAIPLAALRDDIKMGEFKLRHAFAARRWGLIAECKLRSPAKGDLCQNYTVDQLAEIYEANGATALSVHTDKHFKGCLDDLRRISAMTRLPVLRKDFIIDEYQIYEARAAGADAVLLIARILAPVQLAEYVQTAHSIGLDCLVEVHSEADMKAAMASPASLIGINNRNLRDFTTDIAATLRLIKHCAPDRICISESGIAGRADVETLQAAGVRGALIGEGLVTAPDIAAKTRLMADE